MKLVEILQHRASCIAADGSRRYALAALRTRVRLRSEPRAAPQTLLATLRAARVHGESDEEVSISSSTDDDRIGDDGKLGSSRPFWCIGIGRSDVVRMTERIDTDPVVAVGDEVGRRRRGQASGA